MALPLFPRQRRSGRSRLSIQGLEERRLLAITAGVDEPLEATAAFQPALPETPGLFDPSLGQFFARNRFTQGLSDFTQFLATPGCELLVGDWNGDGIATPGAYDPATSGWTLTNTFDLNPSDLIEFSYGPAGAGWIPLAGDWDGDGRDSIGFYDPERAQWFFRNALSQGLSDITFFFGRAGSSWYPLVGDWDADGRDSAGFYDRSLAQWFFKNAASAGLSDHTFFYGMAGASWQPLSGDWDGDGHDTAGFFDGATATWFLKNEPAQGLSDTTFGYGVPASNWRALIGNWGDDAGDQAAPSVQVDLLADTGISATDRLTSTAALQASAVDSSGLASLRIGVDDAPLTSYRNVLALLEPNGSLVLPSSLFDDLAGGRLTDGPHRLHLRAGDTAGNPAAVASLFLTLDATAPFVSLAAPLAGQQVTEQSPLEGSIFDLAGLTSASYLLAGGAPLPLLIDGGGGFRTTLAPAVPTAGPQPLRIEAVDRAGNLGFADLAVSVVESLPFTVTGQSPLDGGIEVGVTSRPRVFFSSPVDPTSLTSANFLLSQSGQPIAARVVPAGDGLSAWLYPAEPLPPSALVTLTLVGGTVLPPGGGAPLDADGDGTPGGTYTARFTTVSLTPLANTRMVGRLVDPGPDLMPHTADDFLPGTDGLPGTDDDVFLLPIAGVEVFILGPEEQAVFTDADGYFVLPSVPAGNVKVATNGRTATNPPPGQYFPEMVMDAMARVGVDNFVMPGMETMYLPRLEQTILKTIDTDQTHRLVLEPAAAFDLTDAERQRLTIEIAPGSLVDASGAPVATAQVGLSVVPPELVRDMLPPGVLQHAFDITVQAFGFANFSTPAVLTFPNVFGAVPGEKLEFLSFDHTTGRLEIEGTATVSADGLTIRTDPGGGLTHPGWAAVTPPQGDCVTMRPLAWSGQTDRIPSFSRFVTVSSVM